MTAVEYLLDQMFIHGGLKKEQGVMYVSPELVAKTKEMEKEQIIDTFYDKTKEKDLLCLRTGDIHIQQEEV